MSAIPKAVLYYSPISIWSAVVLLTIAEKGYGKDELEYRVVDIGKGENFDPTFLRINPKATVPTLVVPYENSLTGGTESRYKALTGTIAAVEFLDKSRSPLSRTHTTSQAPAPALTPATIAGSNVCKTVIDDIIHSNEADPNTLRFMNGRNQEQLQKVAKQYLGMCQERQAVLKGYLGQADDGTIKVSDKVKGLWTEKLHQTTFLIEVYQEAEKARDQLSENGKATRDRYVDMAKQVWEAQLGAVLGRLNKEISGPYILGDQFSIADLHVAGWLSCLASLVGATGDDSGKAVVDKIEEYVGNGFKIDKEENKKSKIEIFWDGLKVRESWKLVYSEGLY
ncbi:hypothetical protein CVT24_012367 [Panaeolus cyanescens]|uniref:GST N-terminal domain-containing protein n=1 Tax=Panaeolus cyanescens TaxID=181874 RepID=A0A409YYX5_9AGAR|nr:hypothetical protein CVT24_012367 [Panaeolus cyanescens]